MSMRFLSTALAACVLPSFAAAQEKKATFEHPYAKLKVGEWWTYANSTDAMGQKIEQTTTTRVVAKDAKSVTIKTGGKSVFMGMTIDVPETESKIDLNLPNDPKTPEPKEKKDDTKVEKIGEGKEKLKVGGKDIECTWTKTKVTTKMDGKQVVTESTMWVSQDVPMSMVKMVTKFEGGSSTMELKDFGTGKK